MLSSCQSFSNLLLFFSFSLKFLSDVIEDNTWSLATSSRNCRVSSGPISLSSLASSWPVNDEMISEYQMSNSVYAIICTACLISYYFRLRQTKGVMISVRLTFRSVSGHSQVSQHTLSDRRSLKYCVLFNVILILYYFSDSCTCLRKEKTLT